MIYSVVSSLNDHIKLGYFCKTVLFLIFINLYGYKCLHLGLDAKNSQFKVIYFIGLGYDSHVISSANLLKLNNDCINICMHITE